MSQKTFCDLCAKEIKEQSYEQFDLPDGIKLTLSFNAVRTTYRTINNQDVPITEQVDICYECVAEEVEKHNGR